MGDYLSQPIKAKVSAEDGTAKVRAMSIVAEIRQLFDAGLEEDNGGRSSLSGEFG